MKYRYEFLYDSRQDYLWDEYQDYIAQKPMTAYERRLVRNWVKEGNSVYGCRQSRYYGESAHPMEFLEVYRMDRSIDKDLQGKTPREREAYLKDLLEKDVDESYYLSEERIRNLLASTEKESGRGNGFGFMPKDPDECDTSSAVLATTGSRKTDNFIAEPAMLSQVRTEEMREERHRHGGDHGLKWGRKELRPREDGLCNTLTSNIAKDNLLMERSIMALPHGYYQGGEFDMEAPSVKASAYTETNMVVERSVLGWSRDEHGNVTDRHPVDVANCVTSEKGSNMQNYVKEQILLNGDSEGNASTITTGHDCASHITEPVGGHRQMGVLEYIVEDSQGNRRIKCVRIRRLTPRELFRLMDVDDSKIDKLLSVGIPKTQLAKMAGNSIVVNVLYHIFKRLFVDTEPPVNEQLKLF